MKRWMDISGALLGLFLAAPLLLLIAVAVRWVHGSPVLFRQLRPGRYEIPFEILKFRTMSDACEPVGILLPDTQRLTPLGRFLRATSLDELPELINVIKGDMSLVGQRPLLMRYTPFFNREERLRFSVRPGITGLAQISGRNDLGWNERFALDIWYVRNVTFWLDLKILTLTIFRVLRRDGLQVDPGSCQIDFDQERMQKQDTPEGAGRQVS